MRKRTAYTSVMLALTCCCSTAHAAKNVEVVRYPSLFMFGGIGQSAGVAFSYSEHKTENSSSSAVALRENYSFGTEAALLDPHLLNMQILAGISYSQNFARDTNTKLLNGEYNIVGSAFDMSYHPIVIGSSRSTAVISNGYTPTYSLTNNTHQISLALVNTRLPLQGYYAYSTSESSGLENETSGTTNSIGFSGQYSLPRSDTRFSFNHGKAESEGTTSSSYTLQLTNNLYFDAAQAYALSSSASVSDSTAGEVPQRNVDLAESLNMKFGKAFVGAAGATYNSTSTEDFDGNPQRTNTATINASLSHMLYQSLSTSIAGGYSQGESLGGETSGYGGSVRLGYNKILPAQSLLTFSIDRSTNIQSQNLQDPSTDLRETYLSVTQDQLIPSPTLSGSVTVVEVISFSPLPTNPELQDPAVPVTIYQPDVDYAVESFGAVRILPGGSIPPGSNITVSYSILANSQIEMRLDNTTTSASLALFGGRYNIAGNYAVQNQKLISGEADNQALVDSRTLSLMAAANYNPTLVGMEYNRQSSSQETSSRIAAYGSHTILTDSGVSMSFNVRNSYSMVEKDQQGNAGSKQNNFTVSATYARRFFNFVSFSLSLGASDSRGDGRSSDFINVRAVSSGSYNQLQFSLSGQTMYRIAGNATTRDSNITASLTRFF